jgi:predicted DNA-binding transcriptional regulator YafY
MKIDRLLSIVIHLLSRDLVSASDLAERFGVTVRTIQRDVDAINAAGIPVTAIHGPSGGYKILDTFRLDRQFLSFDDLFFISTALQGIADSLENKAVEKTVDKIRSLTSRHPGSELARRAERLCIDFGALGYSANRRSHMTLIQNALERNRCISFTYTNARLEQSKRVVEPYTLVFKWYSWYLLAWCRTRKDFRLFRISRIRTPELGHEIFRRRPLNVEELLDTLMKSSPKGTPVVLRFKPELRVMVEDYFAFGEIADASDGSLTVTVDFPEDNWLYGMILSYGDGVEVLAPGHLRTRIADICRRTGKIYE